MTLRKHRQIQPYQPSDGDLVLGQDRICEGGIARVHVLPNPCWWSNLKDALYGAGLDATVQGFVISCHLWQVLPCAAPAVEDAFRIL